MSTQFRRTLSQAKAGLVIKPLLQNYLHGHEWGEDFVVHFNAGKQDRKPDGWFHPSSHPLMPERMLYWYLAGDKWLNEPMDYFGVISVTMGTAVHDFIEFCLTDMGIRLNREELIDAGFEVPEDPAKSEPLVSDVVTGARGAMDGVVKLPDGSLAAFEFKTTGPMHLRSVNDLDLAWFRDKWPGYYAQLQEYLRLSGLSQAIVIIMGLSYPWDMIEVHMPADEFFQMDLRKKYLSVRADVESGELPPPCCSPGSKEARVCPARLVCPNGATK